MSPETEPALKVHGYKVLRSDHEGVSVAAVAIDSEDMFATVLTLCLERATRTTADVKDRSWADRLGYCVGSGPAFRDCFSGARVKEPCIGSRRNSPHIVSDAYPPTAVDTTRHRHRPASSPRVRSGPQPQPRRSRPTPPRTFRYTRRRSEFRAENSHPLCALSVCVEHAACSALANRRARQCGRSPGGSARTVRTDGRWSV